MNLGLGNLLELKAQVLNESLRAATSYDDALALIGKGTAALFDTYCNRGLARIADAEDIFTSDRGHWFLRRYPVESISKVETRTSEDEDWVVQTDAIQNQRPDNGWVEFLNVEGRDSDLTRVTYTGGYWFDTSEDSENPDDQPAGSTVVPDDLKFAWVTQVQHAWDSRDKLGLGTGDKPLTQTRLLQIQLLPAVQEILRGYIRYVIT